MKPHMRLLPVILSLVLAGCSAASFRDLPPDVGGLPTDAPAAPETVYQYPAVHDLPPPRATRTLSEQELLNAENALKAARERQRRLQKAVEDEDKRVNQNVDQPKA